MAQHSRPWPGRVVGDAGPYTAEDWYHIWGILFGSQTMPYNNRGVIRNWTYELEVTAAPPNAVNVNTGAALVYGIFYGNTEIVNVPVPSSSGPGQWREDVICARADWLAQTVRIARHANPGENVPYPALTQSSGTTWEIPLFAVRIDNVGTITQITDLREYVSNLMQPKQLQVQAAPNTASPQAIWSEHQCRAIAKLTDSNVFCAFSFVVPSDFVSLLSATIYVWTNANGTFNWELLMMAAHCNQLTNAVTDSKAAADKVSTAVTMYCLDAITALDDIVAGHHVGLTFKLNAIGTCTAVNVATLLLEYR